MRQLGPVLVLFALGVLAQSPGGASVTLVPNYTAGEHLDYVISMRTSIVGQAQLRIAARADMRILPGAAPGRFTAVLRFTRFHSSVQAANPALRASLTRQAAATDRAALRMTPLRVQASAGAFRVLARAQGGVYDEPVEMLSELARTDVLPSGPVAVGDSWTRVRHQAIPSVQADVTLTLDCRLSALGRFDHAPAATITLRSRGQANLAPGAIPASPALAARGLVPTGSATFDTTATSVYRTSDAVLERVTSVSHNGLVIRYVGPGPAEPPSDTEIDSSATVTLVPAGGGSPAP